MTITLVAGLITFVFTALLTIAGVGAAFILIPVFIALGIEIHVSMSTALLLNSIAMIFASYRFIKNRLIMWKVAIPILIVATSLSPLGAYTSQFLDRTVLLWMFTGFLLFAAYMMLFYESKEKEEMSSRSKQLISGISVGVCSAWAEVTL